MLQTSSIKGFEYEEIIIFLDKFHGTIIECLETSDLGILNERIFIIECLVRWPTSTKQKSHLENKNLFLKAILFLQSLNDLIQNHNADEIRE